MNIQSCAGRPFDEHKSLIDQAECLDSKRYSVARRLMHGSTAVTNELLMTLTAEAEISIANLRAHEVNHIPEARHHIMTNWAKFYGDNASGALRNPDGRRKNKPKGCAR